MCPFYAAHECFIKFLRKYLKQAYIGKPSKNLRTISFIYSTSLSTHCIGHIMTGSFFVVFFGFFFFFFVGGGLVHTVGQGSVLYTANQQQATTSFPT